MKAVVIVIAVLLSGLLYGQTSDSIDLRCGVIVDEDTLGQVYDFAEVMPEFPGDSMLTYFAKRVKHPGTVSCVASKVYVSFIVLSDGRPANVQLAKQHECPEVAIAVRDVFCGMPAWIPAQFNGKPVSVRMSVPININWQK